jgi:hypothetical protein
MSVKSKFSSSSLLLSARFMSNFFISCTSLLMFLPIVILIVLSPFKTFYLPKMMSFFSYLSFAFLGVSLKL